MGIYRGDVQPDAECKLFQGVCYKEEQKNGIRKKGSNFKIVIEDGNDLIRKKLKMQEILDSCR